MDKTLITSDDQKHSIYSKAEDNLFIDLILKSTLQKENEAIELLGKYGLANDSDWYQIDQLEEDNKEKFRQLTKAKWSYINKNSNKFEYQDGEDTKKGFKILKDLYKSKKVSDRFQIDNLKDKKYFKQDSKQDLDLPKFKIIKENNQDQDELQDKAKDKHETVYIFKVLGTNGNVILKEEMQKIEDKDINSSDFIDLTFLSKEEAKKFKTFLKGDDFKKYIKFKLDSLYPIFRMIRRDMFDDILEVQNADREVGGQ